MDRILAKREQIEKLQIDIAEDLAKVEDLAEDAGSEVEGVAINELQGEKIDIIPWSEDSAAFIVNSLSPAEVTKVVLDEENKKVEVVVPDIWPICSC